MSLYTVQKLIYQLNRDPHTRARYDADFEDLLFGREIPRDHRRRVTRGQPQQEEDEDEHFQITDKADVLENDGPGEEEHRLDVEDDEQYGDHEVLDVKQAARRFTHVIDPALVRAIFFGIGIGGPE